MKRSCVNLAICSIFLFGMCAMACAMGRVPKKEYDAKVSELEKSKKECAENAASLQSKLDEQSAQSKEKIDVLETTNAQLLKDMDSSKSELQQRVSELTKVKQDTEKEKSDEIQKLKSTYDNLVSDMKKEIDQGSIQISQLQNKLSVNLVDKILFNSGESDVSEQGKQVLKKVANILKKVQGKQIRIEGHTDNVPVGDMLKEKFPSNWELSASRATNVTRYLQDVGGIDPKYLSAAGYAEYKPIADNATREGKAKNRRIEIALVPLEISPTPSAVTPGIPQPKKTTEAPLKAPQ